MGVKGKWMVGDGRRDKVRPKDPSSGTQRQEAVRLVTTYLLRLKYFRKQTNQLRMRPKRIGSVCLCPSSKEKVRGGLQIFVKFVLPHLCHLCCNERAGKIHAILYHRIADRSSFNDYESKHFTLL